MAVRRISGSEPDREDSCHLDHVSYRINHVVSMHVGKRQLSAEPVTC